MPERIPIIHFRFFLMETIPETFNGVWAVQYNHATKKEIAREDLKCMVIAAVLTSN
jgi:hypothetical protein